MGAQVGALKMILCHSAEVAQHLKWRQYVTYNTAQTNNHTGDWERQRTTNSMYTAVI